MVHTHTEAVTDITGWIKKSKWWREQVFQKGLGWELSRNDKKLIVQVYGDAGIAVVVRTVSELAGYLCYSCGMYCFRGA